MEQKIVTEQEINNTLRREKEKLEKQQQLKEEVGSRVFLNLESSLGTAYQDGNL